MQSQTVLVQISALSAMLTAAAAARLGVRGKMQPAAQLAGQSESLSADLMAGRAAREAGRAVTEETVQKDLAEVAATWAAANGKDCEHAQVEEAPIARITNTVIQQAIRARASHIHIFPVRSEAMVYYRIDGIMHHALTMPAYIREPLLARIRVMASIDLVARSTAQHGRIEVKYMLRQ